MTAEDAPVADGDRRRQLNRILVNLGAIVAVNLLSLVTGPILAHALGPRDRGIFAAVLLWPTLVGSAVDLGVQDSVTYYTSRGDVDPRSVLADSARLGVYQSIGAALVGVPLVFLTMHRFGSAAVLSGLIYLAAMPFQIFAIYRMYILNGQHRYNLFNFIQVWVYLATALAYTGLLIAGVLSVRSAAISAAACIASTWVLSVLVMRNMPVRGAPHVPGLLRNLCTYGLRSYASNLPHMLNDRVDQLIISVVLPARELGLYVVAATIASAPAYVGMAVANSVLPTLASLKTKQEQVSAARRSLALTVLLTAAAALVLIAIMNPFITLIFGHAFRGAITSARILVLGSIVLSSTRSFHGLLKGLGHPSDAGWSEIGALAVTFIGLAISLPLLGIVGAAWTSLAAYTTSTLIGVYWAARRLEVHPLALFWRI
ncbi:MAG: oligosaccharide flippase family protein [Solirubrobacterales bacterium]|nr:oligosaccharide flippase family protein [Solirubrobacterales bacterium]